MSEARVVTVADGDIEVEVLPGMGARLHRLRVLGHDLLRTPEDPSAHAREPVFWGSYVMAPWCNRLEAGTRVAVGSRDVELPANFPDGSAIHGQVFAVPWEMDGEGSFVARGGGDGWPWEYEVRQRIGIDARGGRLRLDHSLTNLSDGSMPAGIGIHPWFLRPLRIAIRAERVYTANTSPEPEPIPVAGSFDLRAMRDVPDDLDGCWAEVAEPPVELGWPAAGIRATMRASVAIEGVAPGAGLGAGVSGTAAGDDAFAAMRLDTSSLPQDASDLLHIVMASPAHLDAVGVEPQTNAPQGLRRLLDGRPGGLLILGPGEALRLVVDLAFRELSTGD